MESRFLLDGMLGKLARWLRILGYDTAYEPDLDDAELLRVAANESRILVTRDKDLHRTAIMKGLKSHFLENVRLSDWLLSLQAKYNLSIELETVEPRCSLCNRLLVKSRKDAILKTVPTRVRERNTKFWHCPSCRKTYWQGTHWENMKSFLQSISLEGDIQ
jgi:uncharacterized protein